ncbi:MAG: type III secretion system chaperone [Kiritimatiellae bacterium]|nr:type III secretion system chaperone [Kiritimatiellia bacterium]
MELKELMSAFAETLGIDGIEVKDGVCSMTIDDIPMEFTESPGGEAVVGAAVIGEPPPDKREAFYEMLLEANTQLYGTLGVALSKLPETGEIALIGGLPFKGLELKEFCQGLDEFVSKAEEWRETLENFRPAAEEAAVRDEEAAQFRRFGMNGPGFMSV